MGFCKLSGDIALKCFTWYILQLQNTAYCCFEPENCYFVSGSMCKALFGEGKESDSKTLRHDAEEILVMFEKWHYKAVQSYSW